jgi:hypothetical protein
MDRQHGFPKDLIFRPLFPPPRVTRRPNRSVDRPIPPNTTPPTPQESSIIWAHWLIRTYTLGALDTKRIALVARLDPLLAALSLSPSPQEGEEKDTSTDAATALPALLAEAGIAHLNVFVSPALAAEAPDVCRALAKAGHTLGLETAAGACVGVRG